MPDPAVTAALKLLWPIVAATSRRLARVQAEKAAADGGGIPQLLRPSLEETLRRLQGGRLEDPWWQRLRDFVSHPTIAPDWLKTDAVRAWLSEEIVADALLELAEHRLVSAGGSAEGPRERAETKYREYTAADRAAAQSAVETVVSVLIAGSLASIPKEQRLVAGLLQSALHRLPTEPDPITRTTHSQLAERELNTLLERRSLSFLEPHKGALSLLSRVTIGELRAADPTIRSKIQYWAALLCASQPATLNTAKHLRADLSSDPALDVTIIDARIAEADGDDDAALRRLRDIDSIEGRSAFFGALARIRGNRTALSWFEERDGRESRAFFTPTGWRNWAFAMVNEGRWEEVAKRLADLGPGLATDAGLAQMEGVVNTALLLPADFRVRVLEGVPLYHGIELHRTPDVAKYHDRATECFQRLTCHLHDLDHAGFRRYVESWRLSLRLLSPDSGAVQAGRDEVRGEMRNGARAVSLAPIAWAFDIEFADGPLRAWLDGRRELGGLSADERLAECLANLRSAPPAEFLRYLTEHRSQLESVVPAATLTIMECEACVQADQPERAHSIAEAARDSLADGDYERLLAGIESASGADPSARLETAYRADPSLQNLKALVAHLRDRGTVERVRILARELFKQERTPANARLVAMADESAPGAAVGASLEFLDSIPELIAENEDLQALRAQALFAHGRFDEAMVLNDALLQRRAVWQDTELAVYLALHMGEWKRLACILESEWPNRHRRGAHTLLQLAHLTAESGAADARAIALARLAVERGGDDPAILAGAYILHVRLDQEDKMDPSWLSRAAVESASRGPVRPVSLDALVRDVVPRRQEHVDMVVEQLTAGRLPLSLAASQFNVPLLNVFFQSADDGERIQDGRCRVLLPIVSGSRGSVAIEDAWTVGLDITSILLLRRLGLLDEALDSLSKVVLSPDVFSVLFVERHMARFHQPSRIRDARELEVECESGRIHCLTTEATKDSELVSEVGPQLAALLVAARSRGGTVVCERPIYRFGSLLDREAVVGGWRDLLVSPFELCEKMLESGQLSSNARDRARQLLPDRPWRCDRGSESLDGPIYVDTLALNRLQYARMLGSLTAAGLDMWIHGDVLAEARRLASRGSVTEGLVGHVEGIRSSLRKAIQKGAASLLPRCGASSAHSSSEAGAWISTQSLLRAADHCDAVCVDERALNALGGVTDQSGGAVPIVSALDILRRMRNRAVIRTNDYWVALHKLRRGGFLFVPADAEELGVRVRQTLGATSAAADTPELRLIRQQAARAEIEGMCTPAEMVVMSAAAGQATVRAIRDLWTDGDLATEDAAHLSHRLWHQLMEIPFGSVDAGSDEAAQRRRDWFVLSLGLLLWPIVAISDDRRRGYSQWLGSHVKGLQASRAHLIQEAVEAVRRDIKGLEEHRDIVGHLFLKQLPDGLRRRVIREHLAFAKACGFERRSVVTVDGVLQLEATTLLSVSRQALHSGSATNAHDLKGRPVVVAPLTDGAGVEIRWTEGETPRTASMPDLALLAPARASRRDGLRRLVARLGPTATRAHTLLEKANADPLKDEDVELLMRESARGLTNLQSTCAHAVRSGTFGGADIVPDSVSYFEDLVGPPPGVLGTDAYAQQSLAPFRKQLLQRDLTKGLRLALLGALRDDLCPGQWLTPYKNDRVWAALAGAEQSSNPFLLLGALDVALYRADDARFRELVARLVTCLADPQLGRPDGADRYRLLAGLCGLVQSRVVVLPGCATRPNYWRRACALMHAGWLLDEFERTAIWASVENFLGWLGGGPQLTARYADAIGARTEPMLHAGFLTDSVLRDEVVGRMASLQARHERAGRQTSWSEDTRKAWGRIDRHPRSQVLGFPGPLEGDKRPLGLLPKDAVDAASRDCADRDDISRLRILAMYSQRATPDDSELEAARTAVTEIGGNAFGLDELNELNCASSVAVACRDIALGDEVAKALIRLSSHAPNSEIIHQMVLVMVQTAGVHSKRHLWSEWLEGRLQSFAEHLPGPPSGALRKFLESLRELQVVLPSEEWFHLRAQAVARAGAA